MLTRRSFTLIEILVVIIIIGILASLGLPNFERVREKALDREAKTTLALIRAAERIYKMEEGNYFPSSGTTSEEKAESLNTNLKLSLPTASNPKWTYEVDSSGQAMATREGAGGRVWTLESSGSCEEPACSGTYCPSVSGC